MQKLPIIMAAAAAFAAVSTPGTAAAQDVALRELDMYLDGSATPEAALATATTQMKDGDASGAATTLERILLVDPDAVEVRVRYVSVLCALKDDQAVRSEIGKLAGKAINGADWAAVQSTCGAIAKP